MDAFEFIDTNFIISENKMENEYLQSFLAPDIVWLMKNFDT